MPEEVVFALGTQLLRQGHVHTAIAMGLQYHTYMRPSEVITLQHHQLCPPVKKTLNAYNHWGVVLAPEELGTTTKTGETNESLLINSGYHPRLPSVLSAVHIRNSRKSVFPSLTLAVYEKHFKQAVDALDLPLDLTPHIIRHSGPSNDFYHQRKSIKQIQRHGRWAAEKSVKRYMKSALIMQAWAKLNDTQQHMVVQAAREFPQLIQRAARG